MTDDRVTRLRQIGEGAYVGAVSDDRKAAREAADRIEKLEAELVRTFNNMMGDAKRIEKLEAALTHIYAWYPVSVSDPAQTIKDIREFARNALGEMK